MSEETQEEPQPLKFVYHKLDPNLVRAGVIVLMAGAAEIKREHILARTDTEYFEYLAKKADIFGDLGGAKLSFVLISLLRDLFTNVLKQSPERTTILVEMVLNMALNNTFRAANDDNLPEGPKRNG